MTESATHLEGILYALDRLHDLVETLGLNVPQTAYPATATIQPGVLVQAPVTPGIIKKVRIINTDPARMVWVGNSGVTTASGYPLYPGASEEFALVNDKSLFGVTSGPTVEVRVMEM